MSQLFAVFGNPILHSKSPQLFRSAFKGLSIDAFYTRIRPLSAANIVEIIQQFHIQGANITAPYKEEIMPLVHKLSPDAKAIGAVNTISNSSGELTGHNTDWMGVVYALESAGVELNNAKCLVIGAGGAARAAVYGLQQRGAKVYVTNRTKTKSISLSQQFNCEHIDMEQINEHTFFQCAISTLPANALLPIFDNQMPFNVLLDASYQASTIQNQAHKHGVKIIGGEQWLVHQAIGAFKIFFGRDVSPHYFLNGLKNQLSPSKVSHLFTTDGIDRSAIANQQVELIISSENLNHSQQKSILDEEYSKAFRS